MYQFYIDGVMLPIAPASLDTKIKNKNSTITLLNGDEINIVKSPGLTDISFTALLPNNEYPFSVYNECFQNARYYLDLFERLKTSKQPFLFLVLRIDDNGKTVYQGNSENNQNYYTLESYTIKEDAEKYGIDCGVELSLKQYRQYSTATGKIEINEESATLTNQRENTKQPSKSYTVQEGDTLWNICKKELGDGSKYKEIAEKNNISAPNNIAVGQVIQL